MSMNRRNFIKLAGGAAAASVAQTGVVPTVEARENKEPSPDAVGMLYDATICIGCKACMVACKEANDMPPESEMENPIWDNPMDISDKTLNAIKVYTDGTVEVKDRETDGFSFVKRHCMHCVDASCVSVCPVNAMRKNPVTGVVTHHADVCIGCRYCVLACAYNVPAYEYDDALGQIQKCQFCDHRLAKGELPGCVESCPTGASLFGTYKEVKDEARRRLAMRPGETYEYPIKTVDSPLTHIAEVKPYQNHMYGEEEGGGTQVVMLAGVPFDKLGLPDLPEESAASQSEGVQHTLYKGMIAPAIAFAALVYAARKTAGRAHEVSEHKKPEDE